MRLFLSLAMLAGFLSAAQAGAATIVLKTGHDGTSALAPGAVDPNWMLRIGTGVFGSAVVSHPAQICCGMESTGSGAAWVTDPTVVAGLSATGWTPGVAVTLRTTFDLTGADLATVVLNGVWRVADVTMGIYLNGTQVSGETFSTWFQDSTLGPVTTGFVTGLNTFEIVGRSVNANWDGFWFDGTVAFDRAPPPPPDVPPIPLPAAGWLLLAALGGLAGLRRRRG